MGKPKRGDGGIFSGGTILRMSITALMMDRDDVQTRLY